VIQRRGRLLVLPGYYGFVLKEGEILNPSYWIWPAFRDFADADDPKFWKKVREDSLEALKASASGKLGLPADWVLFKDAGVSVYQERSRFFGYEAVRTLLHLAWDGSLKVFPGPKALLETSRKLGYVPLNVDLIMNHISLEEGPGGFYAVYGRTAKDLGEEDLSRSLFQRAASKVQGEKDDYYSHTLFLLSRTDVSQ
jgi:endoglucanase